jgi:DNA modification methylase
MAGENVRLLLGDCVQRMGEIEDASVDAIICDPPYPHIKRPYGCLTEAEWWDLMMGVCKQARRILKPAGSAVFILQPNSRKVGSMRGWLFEFQAWACREWNMVQDAHWWNTTAPPTVHCQRVNGLMRPSLKACVWLGDPDCYRSQGDVLWAESERNRSRRFSDRCANTLETRPSTMTMREQRCRAAAEDRGGTTPFNVLPIPNSDSSKGTGSNGHSAATPFDVCDWWVRYISPPSGVVCDPFCGSGTVGLAVLKRGRSFVGVEKMPEYYEIASARLAAAQQAQLQFLPLFTEASA